MVLNCAGETRKRDVTTMFTYSHANTPLGQSERAYYLSYFIKRHKPSFSANQNARFLYSPLEIILTSDSHARALY